MAEKIGKSLKHKTMSEAAAEEIRKRILGGVYPPGMRLRQDFLAAEFEMSRIPIREALVFLENEGILTIQAHRGAVVVELSIDEIEELFNIRILLEPFLFRRSVPSLTAQDFAKLERNLAKYSESMDRIDVNAWNDLNTEFHMTLYTHARSPRVTATVNNLLAECDRHTRIQLSNITADRNRAVDEHRHLLQLCREGKFDEGAELMENHIDHIRIVLVELLNERHEAAALQSPLSGEVSSIAQLR
jgi:DNA-binding GntR family transcriptional regulator